MKENDFVLYQTFVDRKEATDLTEELAAKNIEFLIEEAEITFDPAFPVSELDIQLSVKLKLGDFEKADRISLNSFEKLYDGIDEEYYLFEFSNDELIEVLRKRDEWSRFDYFLSQKILKDRGEVVSRDVLDELKNERINDLSHPEQPQSALVVVGYISSFLGGLLGVFIGWHLLTYKKSLPNGEKVHGYLDKDRNHGGYIFLFGLVFFIVCIIVRIVTYD